MCGACGNNAAVSPLQQHLNLSGTKRDFLMWVMAALPSGAAITEVQGVWALKTVTGGTRVYNSPEELLQQLAVQYGIKPDTVAVQH